MIVFLRELKVHSKALLFWCLGVVLLIGSEMTEYTSFKGNGQAVVDLMAQFPKSVRAIFGLSGFDLTKASGYFGMLYMYIAVIAAVHAVLLGSDLIAKEERDKTTEFLYVKPISRVRVVSEKIASGVFNVFLLNIITFLSSFYFINRNSNGEPFIDDLITLMIGLFFLQLIFFFVGTAVAGFNKKPKTSGLISVSVLLLTFIIAVFVNVSEDLNWLSYYTPFKYFDAKNLMDNGFSLIYLSISAIAVVVSIVVTYVCYNSRDLDV